MGDFTPRGRGWNAPTVEQTGRLYRQGIRAAHLLADVVPAPFADCADLVKILDQGQLGSCTAQATSQIIRAAMLRVGAPPGVEFPSRLFGYQLALHADGHFGRDVGTSIGTVMEAYAANGFPRESVWPYDLRNFEQRPSPDSWRQSADQRAVPAVSYHHIAEDSLSRVTTLQRALMDRKLVAFGTLVTDGFCFGNLQPVVQRPSREDAIAGGHAMVVCAYETDMLTGRLRFRVANSWGEGFGEGGFFWMDVDYLTWSETCDFWLVSRAVMFSDAVSP